MDYFKKWGSVIFLFVLALIACAWWISRLMVVGHLKTPWLVVMAVLILLCAFAGYLVNGRIAGILIDERNRMSLSRFQWVMWLIIVLGGYFTIAVWDVTHGQSLPKLDDQLLILLGIVGASPIVSSVIGDKKKLEKDAAEGPRADGDSPAQVGALDANKTVDEASWSDLFMGEDAATRYVVDISRVQALIFTIILGITYLTWLLGVFSTSNFVLTMPEIPADSKFNWLLGISHAAYQGYKMTPKTPSPESKPPTPAGS
jgi:hypothetical protein